jgi:protein-disulfide isomerase
MVKEHKSTDHHKSDDGHKGEHKHHDSHDGHKHTTTHTAHKAHSKETSQTTVIVTTVIITVLVVLAVILLINLVSKGMGGFGDSSFDNNYGSTNPDAITIIEWSDFECSFCARAAPTVKQIKQTYGDKVNIIYKHFPLSFHPNAQKAAEASECARDQGKFWEYHDVLFANQQALGVTSLKQYAVNLGLDASKFNSCLDSGEKAGVVARDMAEGQAFGVSGTPGFSVGGQLVSGAQPFSAFKTIIDQQLSQKGVAVEPVKPDPVVQMIVINDPTCPACDSEMVVELTQTQLFPTVVVERLTKDDAKAKALIAELGLNALPAFIFSSEVTQTAMYPQVANALINVGEYHYIVPGAAGPVKLINMPDVSGQQFLGDANAPVTLIEWSDFSCGFCGKFHKETLPAIKSTYVETGKVKYVLMHFPVIGQNSRIAALASECANEQGKFWEYVDVLFNNQGALANANLKTYASQLGLDTTQFNTCLDTAKYDAKVTANQELGQSVGVSGTPGFVLNGVSISGAQPFNVFSAAIDAELAN